MGDLVEWLRSEDAAHAEGWIVQQLAKLRRARRRPFTKAFYIAAHAALRAHNSGGSVVRGDSEPAYDQFARRRIRAR